MYIKKSRRMRNPSGVLRAELVPHMWRLAYAWWCRFYPPGQRRGPVERCWHDAISPEKWQGFGRVVSPMTLKNLEALKSRFSIGPQLGRDNPLNLSISLSGGKETNKDSLSSGE